VQSVKIIPWYFYPECANKSLFKSKAAQLDLSAVLNGIEVIKREYALTMDPHESRKV
jgi:hypothetical protein